jgi:hypothetical protein
MRTYGSPRGGTLCVTDAGSRDLGHRSGEANWPSQIRCQRAEAIAQMFAGSERELAHRSVLCTFGADCKMNGAGT